MSEQISSSVFSRYTQVHSGPGPQYNTIITQSLADTEGKPFRTIAADQLLWLRRRFVHPSGFGDARDMLISQRTVLLDGKPGSGRLAAAQMLLHELRVGDETFKEIPLDNENDEAKPLISCDGIADGDLLLLDLSEIEGKLWARAHRELHSLRAKVHKCRAHLVVVLAQANAERLEPGLRQYHVRLAPPPGPQVLQCYLRQDGLSWDEMSCPSPAVTEFLGGEPSMQDVARFAGLVAEARATSGGTSDFVAWCKEANAALSDRQIQLTDQLSRLRDGRQRALLLATAMLHGEHADAVHEAAASLLKEVKHPEEDLPLLEHADLAQRFCEIDAERDAQDRVRFKELGYAAAVRRHFWRHVPELRQSLGTWVGRTAVSTSLDQDGRDKLVRRFAELCLHDRYRGMLSTLVEAWTAKAMNGTGRRAAAQALTQGLQDRRQGRYFRRQIYEWATTNQGLPGTLAEVIVATCTEVMVVHHPYEAVVRLHHLARRERETTRARDALIRLVRADRRLLRLMFDRLNRQFSENRGWKGTDADLFLELADPELLAAAAAGARPLLASDVVRDQVALGWSVVYERGPDDAWDELARRWLLAAGEAGSRHDVLLDVLVEGGRQRTDVLSRLYGMAGELERVHPTPTEHDMRLRDRLLNKINIALGIQVG